MHTCYLEGVERRGCLQEHGVEGWIILTLILKCVCVCEDMFWINLACDKVQRRTV
jgi:hypothetical protein